MTYNATTKQYDYRCLTVDSGVYTTITMDTRAMCSITPCGTEPAWVVGYEVNQSGLPGAAHTHHRFACHRHIHTVLSTAINGVHSRYATVMRFVGV